MNNRMKIPIIFSVFLMLAVSIFVVPIAVAQTPSTNKLEKTLEVLTENAQFLKEIQAFNKQCSEDARSGQFQLFERCLQFQTEYNTMLRLLQSKYPELAKALLSSPDNS